MSAFIQFGTINKDNLKRINQYIMAAGKQGSKFNLAIFPALALIGYSAKLGKIYISKILK